MWELNRHIVKWRVNSRIEWGFIIPTLSAKTFLRDCMCASLWNRVAFHLSGAVNLRLQIDREDNADIPVLIDFFDEWRSEIQGALLSVRIAHESQIRQASWHPADGVIVRNCSKAAVRGGEAR